MNSSSPNPVVSRVTGSVSMHGVKLSVWQRRSPEHQPEL